MTDDALMPFIVKTKDTTHTPNHETIIPDATPTNAGVMSPEMVQKLASLSPDVDNQETVFVFRPGGVAGNNVYTDWDSLYAALNAKPGLRALEFDDSIAPCVVPAGNWNMTSVSWSGPVDAFSPMVVATVQEGAVFTGLRTIKGALSVVFTGATPPVTDFTAGQQDVIFVAQGSSIQCTGTGPFIRTSVPGAEATIALLLNGQLVTGSTPVFDVNGVGAIGIVAVFNISTVQPNTVSGTVGAALLRVILASSGFIDVNQPAFLGATQDSNTSLIRFTPTSVKTSADSPYSANHNELVLVDLSTGNVNVVLPSAANARGMQVTTKIINSVPEVSNLSVTAQPGNTVDGNVAIIFNNPRGSAMFVSDGDTDWLLQAKV